MYAVITKQTRPNTSIPFLDLAGTVSLDFQNYFKATYLDTGKYIGVIDSSLLEDGLVLTQTAIWQTLEDHDQFLSDPIVRVHMIDAYSNYNSPRGIIRELVSRTQLA